MDTGTESSPTWIITTRDVSHAVRVEGESQLFAAMIVDPATGLVHGASIAPTRGDVLAQTLQTALTRPPPPAPAQQPERVLCGHGQAAEVSDQLGKLLANAPPEITETEPVAAVEDIFDSFIGHMSGRQQPDELPEPADWQLLTALTHDYYEAEPWRHWDDTNHLDLTVRVGGAATRYVAIVLGQEGVQHGLVLYPGAVVPDGLSDWEPGRSVPVPPGTLMCYLDPPGEVPPEFAAKAARYDWPADADLVPMWVASEPDGGADVSRQNVHHLTLAVAAVLSHDSATADRTTGQLTLATGDHGEFTVTGE